MKDVEFVELAAGLRTSAEIEADGGTPGAEPVLDSLIGVARGIEAQTSASAKGILVTELFDGLGDNIMGLKKNARVIARHRSVEALVTGLEFRKDALVLDIADTAPETDEEKR